MHGYVFHIKKVPNYDRYNGLHKLKMLDAIDDGDVAMIVDADVIITNFNYKIEDFFEFGNELFLADGANCGVMIVRKTFRGITDVITEDIKAGKFDCEQDAIGYLISTNKSWNVKILPHPCFNSYLSELYPEIPQPVTEEEGQWIEGKSFILHLPALPLEKRIEIMKNTKITR